MTKIFDLIGFWLINFAKVSAVWAAENVDPKIVFLIKSRLFIFAVLFLSSFWYEYNDFKTSEKELFYLPDINRITYIPANSDKYNF